MKDYSITKITFTLLISTFVLISCSKDSKSIDQVSETLNQSVTNFLDSYYGIENYTIGEKAKTSVGTKDLIVKKILLKDNINRVGYIVLDKNDLELKYFADLNKDENKIVTKDFIKNNSDELINLKSDEIFSINFIEELNKENRYTTLKKKRFWGWMCGGSYQLEEGSCYRTCAYYVLWKSVDVQVRACSDLPGRYGK